MFDPSRSLFAGMSRAQLEAALKAAQDAYIELSTGAKGVSFSYAQGDGTRSVTYQQTDLAQLASLIQMLQAQLGLARPRKPVRFSY